jgi:UPF0716 protein FxsA
VLLLILFIGVPALELWLLFQIGGEIGVLPTIALLLGAGVFGSWLAKREGMRVLREMQRAVAEGRVPAEGLLSGALVLVGGVLLVTPGVATDVVGLLLLLPPTRRVAAGLLRRWFERQVRSGRIKVIRPPDDVRDDVIDV